MTSNEENSKCGQSEHGVGTRDARREDGSSLDRLALLAQRQEGCRELALGGTPVRLWLNGLCLFTSIVHLLQHDRLRPSHETRSRTSHLAARGVGFSIFESPAHEMLCAGTPRRVEYEDLRLRRRKRSRAHTRHQQLKPLPSGVREIMTLSLNRVSMSIVHPVFSPRIRSRVSQVSCGISHCIALIVADQSDASSDSLFAWGIGVYGQLGLGEQQRADSMAPVHVIAELQEQIQSTGATGSAEVRCGPFVSCVFFKNTSEVWHWGLLPSGGGGDVSAGKFVLQGTPVVFPMVEDGVELVDVAVGLEHMTLLAADGQVYTWGYGFHGQLGLGQDIVEVVYQHAQQVEFYHPSRVSITAISCGWHHTLALTSDNTVYAWGSNRLGACGAATKFHEYYTPVPVALPVLRSREDGSDADTNSFSVSCCGDTSVLVVRHRTTGVLAAAFAWGVCSGTMSALTPTEVSGIQWHARLADCRAGLGVLQWSYEADTKRSGGRCPLVLQIRVETLPASRVLQVGEVLVLRLGRICGNDCVQHDRLNHDQIAVRQMSSSFTEDGIHGCSGQILQLMEIGSSFEDHSSSELEVKLQAVTAGNVDIMLLYAGIPVFGSPVQVRVLTPEQDTGERGSFVGCSHTRRAIVQAISIVAEDAQGPLNRMHQTIADLRWISLCAQRVRMCANDTLVLLIEGKHSITEEEVIQVQSMFGDSIDVKVRILSVITDVRQPRRLVCATLRIAQLGEFTVALTHSGSALGTSIKLLDVVCVMDPDTKCRLLKANAAFVERHVNRAIGSSAVSGYATESDGASTRARFSAFVSFLLLKSPLRDALANTPLASTADIENAIDWDYDCEVESRLLLCSRQDDPFVLWRTPLRPALKKKAISLNEQQAGGHCGFWDAVPMWTVDNPVTIDLSLVVVHAPVDDVDSPLDDSDVKLAGAIARVRDGASRIGVRVHQSPREFLISGIAELDVVNTPLSGDQHQLAVSAWRDQHGELFYTAQASLMQNYAVVVYGHDSHNFRESATGNLVGQRKSQLHGFLWEVLSTQQCDGVEGLFRSFLHDTPSGGRIASDPDHHIRLRHFASSFENLGFPSAGMSKQEWLTLFTEIQRLAPTATDESVSCAKVTRCVFKTFLLDPHHVVRPQRVCTW